MCEYYTESKGFKNMKVTWDLYLQEEQLVKSFELLFSIFPNYLLPQPAIKIH